MTHAIKDYLLVEVPEDAREIKIVSDDIDVNFLAYQYQENGKWYYIEEVLYNGNWQYITTSELISEEQCKEIVEADILGGYKEYSNDEYDFLPWITALDSFKSLLRSLNLKRAAVLKNQENNLLK